MTSLNISDIGLEYFLEKSPLAKDYCAATKALISPPSKLNELKIKLCDRIKFDCDDVASEPASIAFTDSLSTMTKMEPCPEGYKTIISLVSSSSSLRKLSLGVSHEEYLLNDFATNNHLVVLEIKCVPFFPLFAPGNWPALVSDVVRIVQHSAGLQMLKLGVFEDEKDVGAMREITPALHGNKTLRRLHLSLLPFPRSGNMQLLEGNLKAIDSRVRLGCQLRMCQI